MKDCQIKEGSPPPSPGMTAIAMEDDEEEAELQRLLTSDREISPSTSTVLDGRLSEDPSPVAGVMAAMLTVEVVVEEVEPHHVQVAYNQVCIVQEILI